MVSPIHNRNLVADNIAVVIAFLFVEEEQSPSAAGIRSLVESMTSSTESATTILCPNETVPRTQPVVSHGIGLV